LLLMLPPRKVILLVLVTHKTAFMSGKRMPVTLGLTKTASPHMVSRHLTPLQASG
jgi:hypothetical protein